MAEKEVGQEIGVQEVCGEETLGGKEVNCEKALAGQEISCQETLDGKEVNCQEALDEKVDREEKVDLEKTSGKEARPIVGPEDRKRKCVNERAASHAGTNKRVTVAQQTQTNSIARGLSALRAGAASRSIFDDEFITFLTPTNVSRARSALAALGALEHPTFVNSFPRGGLIVTVATVHFQGGTRTAIAYAEPNGRPSELFLFFS